MKKPAYSKKSLAFFILSMLILWGISALILLDSKVSAPACSEHYRADRTVKLDNKTIKAEVAQTAAQREKGLGGKNCIGSYQGMLFVFNESAHYPFWMKDMKFPIDIIWIDSGHNVVTISENVNPSSYPKKYINSKPAKYVLEIKAGSAKSLKIKEGTKVNF